ncbi:hypothetical protein O9X99_05160 [Agrobacterium salinitolerans]|uniref:Uncharacterized protein n=1 Tax=Agrobacterium salinitolerans TaxID=1183413 RepID=A0ABY3BPX6_9HYPH|nr:MULTISPECIES: hypothetical protein [Agrobacterium]MCZ7891052.1 hypothetical protein [Agrobacterium salinitolerans]TRA93255.1 hypothetical protein EXN23_11270 [Agrobacterium salinitolerans]
MKTDAKGAAMEIKRTTIPGLTFSVVVEEVNHRDALGGLICYLASLYRLDPKTQARHLVRRSRIPGAAAEMRNEFQHDGIRAFRRLEAIA